MNQQEGFDIKSRNPTTIKNKDNNDIVHHIIASTNSHGSMATMTLHLDIDRLPDDIRSIISSYSEESSSRSSNGEQQQNNMKHLEKTSTTTTISGSTSDSSSTLTSRTLSSPLNTTTTTSPLALWTSTT